MEKGSKLGGSGKGGDTERRFVQLAPESVAAAGEAIGLTSVAPNVCRALAEDATYRVREVASLCALLLRHGKRRRLTVKDVNHALACSGVPPVLGQGGGLEVSTTQAFTYLPEGDIFVEREGEVDLVEESLGPGWLGEEQRMEVATSWLAVEGAVTPGTEAPALSPALVQYYNSLVTCVLGDSETLCSTILKDVSTNPKLSPLLPFLVTFIRQGMKRHPDKPKLNTRLLRLLSSIFHNPHLNLSPKPYLSHLVTALLTTILSPEPATAELLPLCASILSLALSRWATQVNQLQVQTLRHLREFLGPERSSAPHRQAQHGALATLTLLGDEVLCETPWPDHLVSALEGQEQVPLWGALRRAGAARVNHMLEVSGHCSPDLAFYGRLYEAFGDSLVPEVRRMQGEAAAARVPDKPGPWRLRRVRNMRRQRPDPREAREAPRDSVFTASQNFDFLADMPSDIFDSEMEVDKREGEEQGGLQRQASLSLSCREAFPGCRPVRLLPCLAVVLPMATTWGHDRLRRSRPGHQVTGSGRPSPVQGAVKSAVAWRVLGAGGRVGTALRRAEPGRLAKLPHYTDLLAVVI